MRNAWAKYLGISGGGGTCYDWGGDAHVEAWGEGLGAWAGGELLEGEFYKGFCAGYLEGELK